MTMNDLTRRLREADPVPREPGLSDDQRRDLRRQIVAAAPAVQTPALNLWRTLPMAVAFSLIVAMAVLTVRHVDDGRAEGKTLFPPPVSFSSGAGRTQLQFSTPGGTRIIWTIDPAFHLKEALR